VLAAPYGETAHSTISHNNRPNVSVDVEPAGMTGQADWRLAGCLRAPTVYYASCEIPSAAVNLLFSFQRCVSIAAKKTPLI
jgi:hypothetical protein